MNFYKKTVPINPENAKNFENHTNKSGLYLEKGTLKNVTPPLRDQTASIDSSVKGSSQSAFDESDFGTDYLFGFQKIHSRGGSLIEGSDVQ